MRDSRNLWALALLAACLSLASVTVAKEQVVHSKTYHSPVFELGSGDVTDHYQTLEFPTGHIAMRNFFAEVVDENDVSVPLTEVYLHHWVIFKFKVKKGFTELASPRPKKITDPNIVSNIQEGHRHRMHFQEGADVIEDKKQGTCADSQDVLFYGVGSETRRTDTSLPAPYGVETGNAADVPEGYEEAWYLNVHAIDTRGAVDATSCLECLCEAYGVTMDSRGRPLEEGYKGGLRCCYDQTRCAVKEGAASPPRKLYLKYIVTWVDMDETVIPVRTYSLDATDPRTSLNEKPICKVEYAVEACDKETNSACIDHRQSIGALPQGGDLILAILHQHAGGMGGIISDNNGKVLSIGPNIRHRDRSW
jgi:hypothetical protein